MFRGEVIHDARYESPMVSRGRMVISAAVFPGELDTWPANSFMFRSTGLVLVAFILSVSGSGDRYIRYLGIRRNR